MERGAVGRLDRPRRSTHGRVAHGDVARDRHQRARMPEAGERRDRLLGGEALADAAEIQLDACPRERDGAGRSLQQERVAADPGLRGAELVVGRQASGPPCLAPQVRKRAGGDVERAVGRDAHLLRLRQHLEEVVAHRDGHAARPAEPAELAVLAVVAHRLFKLGESGEGRPGGDARCRLVRRAEGHPGLDPHDDLPVGVRLAVRACGGQRHARGTHGAEPPQNGISP